LGLRYSLRNPHRSVHGGTYGARSENY